MLVPTDKSKEIIKNYEELRSKIRDLIRSIINWLPIKGRYNHCINSIAFKYFDNQCPYYLNEVFMKAPETSSSLRNSYHKLQQPFRKTNTGQNALSFIGPALWNKVPDEIKRTTNLNAFKHNLKKHYLKELGKSNF